MNLTPFSDSSGSELKSLEVDMTKYMLHQQPHYKINQEVIVGPSPSNVDIPI